jgi:hypothetical protein
MLEMVAALQLYSDRGRETRRAGPGRGRERSDDEGRKGEHHVQR